MKFIKENKQEKWALKLLIALLYSLSRRKFGPFAHSPPDSPSDINVDASPIEMLNDLFDKYDRSNKTGAPASESDRRVDATISHDGHTYAAVQEIDNFGVHAFLAASDEPVTEWFTPGKPSDEIEEKSSGEVGVKPRPSFLESHEEALTSPGQQESSFKWVRTSRHKTGLNEKPRSMENDRIECLNSELEEWIDRKFNQKRT